MTTFIERYLNSLSNDIVILDISNKGITFLPDLTKFKNLKKLNCSNNKLTSLPTLPQKLKYLYCYNNKLTSLSTLPQNLKRLYCFNNKLTSLPTLPQNLEELSCYNNELTSLPTLPQNLECFVYCYNPIYEIVNNDSLIKIKQNIVILNNFRYLYYCLKLKKKLRKWLWEKVREPKINKMYNPMNLIKILGNEKSDEDYDYFNKVLENW